MTSKNNDPPPNPAGKNGKPLVIPLEFEDALAAALNTPPPPAEKPKRRAKSRNR